MSVERNERDAFILDRLAADGSLTVAALAKELELSEVTVRATLKALESEGLLVRTHGGARPAAYQSILARQRLNVPAKERIAELAATLVRDDDRIMIEAGTTAALITKYLAGRQGVQIVTNSTLVFSYARRNPALNIILTGGVFKRESESLVGPVAEAAINDFNARITFLGTDGFSLERGLTTQLVEGAQSATAMSRRSEQTWLVADSTKCGKAGFVSFLQLSEITGVITDSQISDKDLTELRENAIEVRVA